MIPQLAPPPRGKLGRIAPIRDPRSPRLRLADYLPSGYHRRLPAETHHSHLVRDWGMLGNDQWGDCVDAAALHMIMLWRAWAGGPVPAFTAQDALAMYAELAGFDPAAGPPGANPTDNGSLESDLLAHWASSGLHGHRIAGTVAVDPRNANEIRAAIYEFGACLVGVALPISAQGQAVWDVTSTVGDGAPGSWGGHAVPYASYDPQRLAAITWGGVQLLTWQWEGTYTDEAHVVLSVDQLRRGRSPLGMSYATLLADLQSL